MPQPDVLSSDLGRDEDKSGGCALCPDRDAVLNEPPLWTYYHKPIIVMIIGGLMLGAGAVTSLLGSFEVTEVPPAIGAVCFSIGLMFLVLGLIWLPIIKDKLRRKGRNVRRRSIQM